MTSKLVIKKNLRDELASNGQSLTEIEHFFLEQAVVHRALLIQPRPKLRKRQIKQAILMSVRAEMRRERR